MVEKGLEVVAEQEDGAIFVAGMAADKEVVVVDDAAGAYLVMLLHLRLVCLRRKIVDG
jgi:hypothetical protein